MPWQLSRRSFNGLLLAGGAAHALRPSSAIAEAEASSSIEELARSFADPPLSTAPHTYWMWMNGNITRQGITLDLEAMKRAGIAGAYIYQCAVGIPRGPVDYGSEAWLDCMHHAVSEASRLGIALAMHNAPGYSGTGGPWITPEMSMQELVWTEALVPGGTVDIKLAQPRTRLGFYRDAYVLAYPSLRVETMVMRESVTQALCNGTSIDTSILWRGNREHKLRLTKQADGSIGSLDIEFNKEFEARAIAVYRSPEDPIDPFDGPRDYPPEMTLQVSGDGIHYADVCTFSTPALRSMNSPGVATFPAVKGRFYRLLSATETWITGVDLQQGPRLRDWAGKANGAARSSGGLEPNMPHDLCVDPATVVDVTRYMQADGRFSWRAPEGRWTIVRFGHTTTAETVAAAPESGIGLECDKLRKDAVDLHFTKSLQPLFAKLGSQVGKTLNALLIDSWEAGKGNWTQAFPAYFERACGYRIEPHLLAMTGRVVGSVEESNRFLFDLRRTQAAMLAENYYAHFQTRCHELGLELHAEPYGDGAFDSMQIAQHLDLVMGEFWARYTYGAKTYIDLAAGVAHTQGKTIVATESFTGAPLTSRWTGHPYSMKAEGDRMFCLGVNRFVFHTFVHQPHPTAKPGMTMGPFGTHFDRNTTWMSEGDTGWIKYLSRAQVLLQSGVAVADVCYLKGEEPVSGVPDPRAGKLAVPEGFGVDVVSPFTLMHAVVRDGLLSFGSSVYSCMIVPPMDRMTPGLLEQLLLLVQHGMVLFTAERPTGSPGLASDAEAARLTTEIWGDLDGRNKRQRSCGKGRVFLVDRVEEAFAAIGLQEDFTFSALNAGADLLYGRRRIEGEEVYLVSNQRRRVEEAICSFRVANARPEIWDAELGTRMGAAMYRVEDGYTKIRLTLPPAGAIFVVFRHSQTPQPEVSVAQDGIVLESLVLPTKTTTAVLVNDFAVVVWAQPETYMLPGTGYLAIPEPGALVHGAGHSIAGIAAGQNGVVVYEQSGPVAEVVLRHMAPLSGWLHLAVVYRSGRPTLYLDGVEATAGEVSRYKVHPPRDCRTPKGPIPRYFEGNQSMPQVMAAASQQDLLALAKVGPPALELRAPMTLERGLDGVLRATAWDAGKYKLTEGSRTRLLEGSAGSAPIELTGPWRLEFPESAGAPATVTMARLTALNLHEDFGVRHFAGTVIYRASFAIKTRPTSGDVIFLDLGRVDVIAKVKLNGHAVGTLWKAPYQLNVTQWIEQGENKLEVAVTCLWPNRLIGDEHLPAENVYDPHGPVVRLPEWYAKGEPKPGQRTTFACWHHYNAGDPLLQSGLSGPVRVLFGHIS